MNDFKLFLPYVKRVSRLYLIGFVGSLFRFLIPLFVPLILKYIFDQLLQNEALSRSEMLEQLFYIGAGMRSFSLHSNPYGIRKAILYS